MRIKEDFMNPFVMDVYYNGYRIKQKKSNDTYENVGDFIPIGREEFIPILLSQVILANMNETLTMKEFHDLRKKVMLEIETKLVKGLIVEEENKVLIAESKL